MLNMSTPVTTIGKADMLPLGELVSAITSLPSLCGLKVSSDTLRSEEMTKLASIVTAHAASLQSVSLCNLAGAGFSVFRFPHEPETGSTVWQALAACSGLTSVELTSTQLHPSLARSLCDTLHQLQSLQELDLSDACCSFRISGHMDKLLSTILSLSNLTNLSLASNRLSHPACKELSLNLYRLQKLCILDVSSNAMPLDGFLLLSVAAASMPSMREFRAEGLRCGVFHSDPDVAAELDMLPMEQYCSEIYSLFAKFVSTPFSMLHSIGASGMREVPGPIQSHIRVLKLSSVSNQAAARYLLKVACMGLVWRHNGSVFSVALPEACTNQQIWKPVDALQKVEVLDLSCVALGESGCFLSKFVASLRQLRELNLSHCMLPPGTLQSLSLELREKVADRAAVGLTSLDWSDNAKLTAASVQAVCGLTTLQRLVLQNCGVGEEVVRLITPCQ